MRRITFASIFALVVLAWTGEARAQATPYEFNAHVGAFKWDDDLGPEDTDVMAGIRFMLHYPSGWGWGGNFDWVKADETRVLPGEDVDTNLYLYSFEIDYTFPSASRAKFFVGAGVGGATIKVDDFDLPGPEAGGGSETHALVPLAGGVKFGNRPTRPTWAIRGDLRDNIIFGDETSHNLEASGGVSFFF